MRIIIPYRPGGKYLLDLDLLAGGGGGGAAAAAAAALSREARSFVISSSAWKCGS